MLSFNSERGIRMIFATRRVATALSGAILANAVLAPAAMAQQTYPPVVEEQCRDDYFRHCSSYSLGSTELRRCMESKGKTLSPNCQQALKDAGFVKTGRNK